MHKRAMVVLSLATILGCDSGPKESSSQAATSASAPAEAPLKPAEPPKPALEDTTFRLAFEGPTSFKAGEPHKLKVVLEPRGGYHVNQDYPIRVDLKAPAAVKLEKPSLGKPDATAFSEENASFDVGFTAEKGSHDLSATVDFAVCTKETCVPDNRTIAIALNVE